MENVIQITSCIRVDPGALLKIPTRESVAERDGMGGIRTTFVDGECTDATPGQLLRHGTA